MKKLQFVITAVLCAALAAPVALWGADDGQPAASKPTTGDNGQSAELTRLKAQLEQQQKQIEALQQALTSQQKLVEKAIGNKGEKPDAASIASGTAPAAQAPAPATAPETDHKAPNLGDVASTTPIIPAGAALARPVSPLLLPSVAAPPPATAMQVIPESPLQFRIGSATFTPVGFMDMTNTFRSTNSGANLATNFGSIPYNNTVGGRLTENNLSPQNSRLGLRVDANYKGFNVLGYWESDFVGGLAANANNINVTSNSWLFRMRLYWVDVRKGKYEFLAGQSWSLITPNRRSISPLPGDLFYGQEFDVNYLNGLTWGRIPGFRFVYHPSTTVAWGISAENTTQYFGGSGGAGTPTLPAAFASLTSNQLDANVANGYALPRVFPDIISKLAFDPSPRAHIEINGVLNHAKIINPNNIPLGQYHTTTGGGGSINGNFEIVKNFRIITNNFWSSGAGRYMFGQAPNFIVRANGSLSNIHSGSTVDGFEWQVTPKSIVYAYYGGIYINRNTALDANGTTLIGYGFVGSANSQNRTTQEVTGGWNYTFFRDPKYGQVSTFLDYAYFFRNPWFVAPNAPKSAFQSAVWFDLRYTLPGAAPTITYR